MVMHAGAVGGRDSTLAVSQRAMRFEALALLEGRRLLTGFALGRSFATGLRDAHELDATALAQGEVSFAEEAAIGAAQFWSPAKGLLVAFQRPL